MTPEEANWLGDLRLRILENTRLGRPPEAGIERDDLKKAISLTRAGYQAAQSKSKASGVTSPSSSKPAIDLASIFTSKKS